MSNLGYCELHVDLTSGTKLYRAIQPHVDEDTKFISINKLHSTIMYDVGSKIIADFSNEVYKAKVVDVSLLGKPGTKYFSCALILECPAIAKRFKDLLHQGFNHSYPDLLQHVSIIYGDDAGVIYPIVKKLFDEGKLPETITLCNETWSELVDD